MSRSLNEYGKFPTNKKGDLLRGERERERLLSLLGERDFGLFGLRDLERELFFAGDLLRDFSLGLISTKFLCINLGGEGSLLGD